MHAQLLAVQHCVAEEGAATPQTEAAIKREEGAEQSGSRCGSTINSIINDSESEVIEVIASGSACVLGSYEESTSPRVAGITTQSSALTSEEDDRTIDACL